MALKHLIAEVESKDIPQKNAERAIQLLKKIARSPKLRKKCHYYRTSVNIDTAFDWRRAPSGFEFWQYIDSAPNKL